MTTTREPASVVQYAMSGSAAWITLDRPQAMNALSVALVEGMLAGLDRAAADPDARTVVITGKGPAFCAGGDLKAVREMLDKPGALGRYVTNGGKLLSRVTSHPLPVIAAVQGMAIAGGLELVLACDLVIASREATFSDGHVRYGLVPGGGGATRLPRRIGATRAKYLLFSGGTWSAETMREYGLVNEVVPADQLRATVERLTERIEAYSSEALRRIKRIVDTGLDLSLEDALALELTELEAHALSGDIAEGLAAFREGRTPIFPRRRTVGASETSADGSGVS